MNIEKEEEIRLRGEDREEKTFLEKMVRDAKTTLEAIAAKKPPKLKSNSVVHESAIPTTISSKDMTVSGRRCSRNTITLRIAEKRGSAALIVCIKEAAEAAVEMLVRMVPIAWNIVNTNNI
jgi:hypothetical protein